MSAYKTFSCRVIFSSEGDVTAESYIEPNRRPPAGAASEVTGVVKIVQVNWGSIQWGKKASYWKNDKEQDWHSPAYSGCLEKMYVHVYIVMQFISFGCTLRLIWSLNGLTQGKNAQFKKSVDLPQPAYAFVRDMSVLT